MQIQNVGTTWYYPPATQWIGEIPRPGGVSEGDLLVLITTCEGYGPNYYFTGIESGGPWNAIIDYNPLGDGTGSTRTQIYWKYATASEPTSYTVNSNTSQDPLYFNQPRVQAFLTAYRGVDSVDAIMGFATAASATTPSVTTDEPQAQNMLFWCCEATTVQASFPDGVNQRAARQSVNQGQIMLLGDALQPQIGASPGYTASGISDFYPSAITLTLRSENSAPNAPAIDSPDGSTTIDREQPQIFSWTYSDPDSEDSQAAYDLRYRVTGDPTWTTVSATTPSTLRQFAANTFAVGDYEWQVRTTDQRGLVSPWSTSGFFSAAEIPKDVTITDPVNGATIGTDTYMVQWSTLNQDAYQIRRVADAAGVPDEATVYSDTGTVVDANARSLIVSFPTNSRYEHVQIRVEKDGLWSAWVSVRVDVSYTPPATPSLTVTAEEETASLLIQVDNPAPGAGEPNVLSNEVFLDEGAGEFLFGVLPPSGAVRYWTPRPGLDYAGLVRVLTRGDNGTSTST